MRKRLISQIVILTVIHIIMTIGSVMLSFGSGMESFDNQDYQPSMIGRTADHLAGILIQPAMSLWTPWMSKNMSNMLEWGFFIANSMLWGAVLAFLINATALRMKRKSDNKTWNAADDNAPL